MRECARCKENKDESEFYKSPKSYCKKCFAAVKAEWLKTPKGIAAQDRAKEAKRKKYSNNKEFKERVNSENKARYEKHKDEMREYGISYSRSYRVDNKEKCYSYQKEYKRINKERDREKNSARTKLQRLARKGDIVRPDECPRCGSDVRIQAHHEDYSKPLDVMWLCEKCHKRLHCGEF